MIEIDQNESFQEDFIERLRRKDQEFEKEQRKIALKNQEYKTLKAQFIGDKYALGVKSLKQLEAEAEAKAILEKQRIELQEINEIQNREKTSKKMLKMAQQENRQFAAQKDRSKSKSSLTTVPPSQDAIFATLKLPQIVHGLEGEDLKQAKRLHQIERQAELSAQVCLKKKASINQQSNDVEILMNKDVFEEIGLL